MWITRVTTTPSVVLAIGLIKKHGLIGCARKASGIITGIIKRKVTETFSWVYYRVRYRNVKRYKNPTPEELLLIEKELHQCRCALKRYHVNLDAFGQFMQEYPFPDDYHGGILGGVWKEKLLEHYIAYDLLDLTSFGQGERYIDVAAGGSDWAKILRERLSLEAYAVDLNISPRFYGLDYYVKEDAVKMPFAEASVRGISLQCAYEMFLDNDDIDFLTEASRVLCPGGKVVINPLYLHTHYCAYSSPEYCGKGYSDKRAKEYIRMDARQIPSSRKYSAEMLKERILERISKLGMTYQIYVLDNKREIDPSIYCHFILEIAKPS